MTKNNHLLLILIINFITKSKINNGKTANFEICYSFLDREDAKKLIKIPQIMRAFIK
jgi:hypothetical protein